MEGTHRPKRLPLFTTSLILTLLLVASTTMGAPVQIHTPSSPETTSEITLNNISIQDTINQAPPGATLQLPAGVTTEILTINKPLCLLGEKTGRTILRPTSADNGYAIRILAEGVTLCDLDITNHGEGLYTTGVKISADNTTIQNCTFHDAPIGVAVWSSQNTITGCDFHRCTDEGIVLLGTTTSQSTQNTIVSCTFQATCDGIELQYAADTKIISCAFTQNTHAGIDAIMAHTTNTTITQCTFKDNQGFGLYLAGSSQTRITSCSFADDSLTLKHATETMLSKSQASHITLLDESSLLIDHCDEIASADIIAQQSTYEIQQDTSNQAPQGKNIPAGVPHPLLTWLARVPMLKSLYEQLYHLTR
jgi:parallel beta-helix repeat protein